jgi:hypothetical protein
MHHDLVFGVVGVLLIALGIPLALGKVGPNPWYGFRLPATLKDRDIWYTVNAQAGRDLVAAGVLLLIVVLIVGRMAGMAPEAAPLVYAIVLLAGAIAGTVRGFRLTSRLARNQAPVDGRGSR